MKTQNWIFILTILCLGISCSRYQYVYLNSNLPKDENRHFVHENDSFRVVYGFQGHNCPVTIEVHNKLPTPLYIDWKNSDISINQETIHIWDEKTPMDGFIEKEPLSGEGLPIPASAQTRSNYQNERISEIPPHAYISVYPLDLTSNFVELLPQDSMTRTSMKGYNGNIRVKRFKYDWYNTPFLFRSNLQLSTRSDFWTVSAPRDSFWISDIIPTYSVLNTDNGYNQFYLEKTTGMGHFLTTTGGIFLLIGLAVLESY